MARIHYLFQVVERNSGEVRESTLVGHTAYRVNFAASHRAEIKFCAVLYCGDYRVRTTDEVGVTVASDRRTIIGEQHFISNIAAAGKRGDGTRMPVACTDIPRQRTPASLLVWSRTIPEFPIPTQVICVSASFPEKEICPPSTGPPLLTEMKLSEISKQLEDSMS